MIGITVAFFFLTKFRENTKMFLVLVFSPLLT